MTIKELKEKTGPELEKLLAELRNKLRAARFKVASKQLTDVRDIREMKRTVARILTLRTADSKKPEA